MAKYYSKDCDYCMTQRGNNTKFEEVMLLKEVDFCCPLCGRKIYGKTKKEKIFEIAHIFPHSPTNEEKKILNGVELLGDNSESFENKIALCETCHHQFDNGKVLSEYENLVSIKKKLNINLQSRENLSGQKIDEGIVELLKSITELSDDDIDMQEKFKALKIKDKIEDKYNHLRRQISRDVSDYYLFIKNQLKILDEKGRKFKLLKAQFSCAYNECLCDNKQDVFNNIVEWLNLKNKTIDRRICEIVVSFFVQDCEIFDEIPK